MPRTRSAHPAENDTAQTAERISTSKHQLHPQQGPAPHLFILPKCASRDARIVSLPHPRHGRPSRYLACPQTGIYEFTTITSPNSAPRSWLVETHAAPTHVQPPDNDRSTSHAQIVSVSELYTATAFDPLFLVLPALAEAKTEKGCEEKRRMFLSSDDHLDRLPEENSDLSKILQWSATRALIESRMEAICDTVDAGDEKMFRINEQKLFALILEKARRMSKGGLPPSLEEKFVRTALDAPVLLQKKDTKPAWSGDTTETDVCSGHSIPTTDSGSCQSPSVASMSGSSSASQASTAATSSFEEPEAADASLTAFQVTPEITELQRLRVAFDFICCRYVPLTLAEQLKALLNRIEVSSIDFTPLDNCLTRLADLRAEAMATISAVDYSRTRPWDEDQAYIRAEKKRKLEEDKKRKANESRGVRDLKKVNTNGMMKLSHFFKAK